MNELFLRVLSMSLSATLLAAAVLLVRPVLKGIKAPKWLICALWGVLALRLVLPFSFESKLSVVPEPVSSGSVVTHYAHEHWEQQEVQRPEPKPLPAQPNLEVTPPVEHQEVEKHLSTTQVLTALWLTGVGAMLIYACFSYGKIRKQVAVSVKEEGVYLCDHLQSPFVLGFFRPRIYLPSDLSGAVKEAVLAHERAHLARHDHWWKPLGFLLLAVHWFNPVLWLCYVLLCRDIESACDEKVVRDLSLQEKKTYSAALLSLSLPRRQLAACPLAFGEVGVKERVKNVLSCKRPAFWVVLASVAAAVVLAVCFLTKPPQEVKQEDITPLQEASRSYDYTMAAQDRAMLWKEDQGKDEDRLKWFLETVEQGEEAFLRIVQWYSEDVSAVYDPRDPAYDITDLTYRDGVYTTQSYENGPDEALVTRTFQYLIVDRFQENGTIGVCFLLSNAPDMTYPRMTAAWLSSVANSDPEALESKVIYCKYKEGQERIHPIQVSKQLSVMADQVSEWGLADLGSPWAFAVTDMNEDGTLELITSITQGSGHVTETKVWSVDSSGEGLTEWSSWNGREQFVLEADLRNGQVMTLPASWDPFGRMQWDIVARSHIQDGGYHWYEHQFTFSFHQSAVDCFYMGQKEVREAEDGTQTVTCTTSNGLYITEEEYENMGASSVWSTPMQVWLMWQPGSAAGTTEKLQTALLESWQNFSFSERDTIYTYEGDGFGGDFTITIKENGTFEYYEGGLSSFIGRGTWEREGNLVTLQERTKRHRFRVTEEGLEFIAQDSNNFGYVQLEDGARFLGNGPLQQVTA